MNTNRLWLLGAALAIGVVAALGWMLGISPKIGEARAARADRVAVEAQNTAFEAQLVTLKKQYESIDELRSELSSLRQAVPNGPDMPDFVGQLDTIAGVHGVTLSSITVSDAQPYVPMVVAPAVEAAPAADAPSGGTATPAPVDAAAAASAAAEAAIASAVPAPVVNPLVTAENFVAVPISLSVDGAYDDVVSFVDGLQKGKRLVMVTTFNTSTPADSGKVTGNITAFIYVLLNPTTDTATAATQTPAG
ncbi:hypothetical protein E3T26_07370 [Cryobacterium sp. TMT1-21]|uniref:Type 4a pilus biogenesis protein PilO n=1 Tax=Cryobacterium shii TaxID=1259235 RepID=A0AAQ2C6I3_9MICO|nr:MULTISPECIES: type 4a pilus biogenesis protein PilO [Cryobacterium]TFC47058.1 hypothetical protein E3O49_08695 [Cryobacterium shii]TFD15310.1 hypothetical protein E3T26_07370 [Cryobacterium sp. TMT1-21]